MGFFGLRNKFLNVQGNKKRDTQKIQVKKQKKTNDVKFFFLDKPKWSHRVDYSAMTKAHEAKKSKLLVVSLTYIKRRFYFFGKNSVFFNFFWKIEETRVKILKHLRNDLVRLRNVSGENMENSRNNPSTVKKKPHRFLYSDTETRSGG